MVERLLQDERVDPSDRDNEALRVSLRHKNIANLLLDNIKVRNSLIKQGLNNIDSDILYYIENEYPKRKELLNMIKLGKSLEPIPSLQYLSTIKYMEEGSLEDIYPIVRKTLHFSHLKRKCYKCGKYF